MLKYLILRSKGISEKDIKKHKNELFEQLYAEVVLKQK